MRKSIIALVLVITWLAISCEAETIIVDPNGSGDFTNIQSAIDYSWHGDTIIVRPGTYNEDVKFNGRAITVTSIDPNNPSVVQDTLIYPSSGNAVTFNFAEDSNSIITGFYIRGGGIRCDASSPTISKNNLRSNSTQTAVRGENGAAPTIHNNNIYTYGIYDCDGIIAGNIISVIGGMSGIRKCDGLIINNIIKNGHTGLNECNGTILNNTIVNHDSYGLLECSAMVKNNIIAYNQYGINYPGINSYNNFWGNETNFYNGATAGIGDICVDPLFASESDYHLKSHAGRWTGTGWVFDDVNSPCIDSGDPSDSVGVEPNPNGGKINMGAYGGTAEASKSPSGIVETVCTEYPATDFNKDCKVDFQDFAIFTQSWLECNLDPQEACWQ